MRAAGRGLVRNLGRLRRGTFDEPGPWVAVPARALLAAEDADEVVREFGGELWAAVLASCWTDVYLGPLEAVLRGLAHVVLGWLYPAVRPAGRRRTPPAERLLGNLLAALSVVRLRLRPEAPAARRVLAALPAPVAAAFRARGEAPAGFEALVAFIRMQRDVLDGRMEDEEEEFLYALWGRVAYLGRARAWRWSRRSLEAGALRSSATPGPVCRLMEHCGERAGVWRSQAAWRYTPAKRYREWRRCEWTDVTWLLLHRGPWKWVHALETACIRELAPPGNRTGPRGSVVWGAEQARKKEKGRRGRPPRWRREREPRRGAHGGPAREQRAVAAAAKDDREDRRQPVRAERPWWAGLSFGAAYDTLVLRRFATWGVEGPLDIAGPDRGLWLLWMAVKRSFLDWKRLEEAWGHREAAAWCSLRAHLLGKTACARVRARCALRLRKRGVPAAGSLAVSVPGAAAAAVAKAGVKAAVGMVARRNPELGEYFRRNAAVRAAAGPSLLDRAQGIRACKEAKLEEVVALGVRELEPLFYGADLERVEASVKVRLRQSPKEAAELGAEGFRRWAARARLSWAARAAGERAAAAAAERAGPPEPPEVAAHAALLQVGPDQVLVRDDKDRGRVWRRTRRGAQADVYRYVFGDPRWRRAPGMTPADADRRVRELCAEGLPAAMQTGGSSGSDSVAPYMHLFVKPKCHRGAKTGLWSCPRPGHSCQRKITSFYHVPHRKGWRMLGRGLMAVIQAEAATWEVYSLDSAPAELQRRVARLRPGAAGPCRCARCGGAKHHREAYVADAAQFFEACSPCQANHEVREACARVAAATGCGAVDIPRAPKAPPRLVAAGAAARPGSVVVSMEELVQGFEANTAMNFVAVGDTVFQSGGLLIGGMLSRVAAAYVAGADEREWDRDREPADQAPFPGGFRAWGHADAGETVARLRYVDDAIFVSDALCRKCLAALSDAVARRVAFEPEEESRRPKWLDLVLDLDGVPPAGQAVRLEMYHHEDRKVAPWVGRWPQGFRVARGTFLGLLARLEVMGADEAAATQAVGVRVSALLSAGYPLSAVRALIFSLGPVGRGLTRVRAALLRAVAAERDEESDGGSEAETDGESVGAGSGPGSESDAWSWSGAEDEEVEPWP